MHRGHFLPTTALGAVNHQSPDDGPNSRTHQYILKRHAVPREEELNILPLSGIQLKLMLADADVVSGLEAGGTQGGDDADLV